MRRSTLGLLATALMLTLPAPAAHASHRLTMQRAQAAAEDYAIGEGMAAAFSSMVALGDAAPEEFSADGAELRDCYRVARTVIDCDYAIKAWNGHQLVWSRPGVAEMVLSGTGLHTGEKRVERVGVY